MGTYTYIEKHAGWAEIVLNRPERRNALIPPMAGEITQAVEGLQTDPEVASILIRGEDGYLCSGIDLKALQADPAPDWQGKEAMSGRCIWHFTDVANPCCVRFKGSPLMPERRWFSPVILP